MVKKGRCHRHRGACGVGIHVDSASGRWGRYYGNTYKSMGLWEDAYCGYLMTSEVALIDERFVAN